MRREVYYVGSQEGRGSLEINLNIHGRALVEGRYGRFYVEKLKKRIKIRDPLSGKTATMSINDFELFLQKESKQGAKASWLIFWLLSQISSSSETKPSYFKSPVRIKYGREKSIVIP